MSTAGRSTGPAVITSELVRRRVDRVHPPEAIPGEAITGEDVRTPPASPEHGLTGLRTGHAWQAFTGLLPALLMVPLLLLGLEAASVVLAAVASLGVVAYHWALQQGLALLDAFAVTFAGANLVLHFGLGSDLLVDNMDVVFYTLLLLTSAASLRRGGVPWTTQFTRRTLVPALWATPAFRSMNVATTRLWVACFAACDAGALLLPVPWQLWSPVAVLVATALVSRRRGRAVLERELRHRGRRPAPAAARGPARDAAEAS